MNPRNGILLIFISIISGLVHGGFEVCKDGSVCSMKEETRCIALQDGLVGPKLDSSKNRFRLYRCDCDLKEGNHDGAHPKYAGYDCEYEITLFCSNNEDGELHFCTENTSYCDANLRCICNEGFEGRSCEYRKGEAPRRLRNYGLIIGISIPLVILSLTLIILIVHFIQFQRDERKATAYTSSEKKENEKNEDAAQRENMETNDQENDAQSEQEEEIAIINCGSVCNDKKNRQALICFNVFFLTLLVVIWGIMSTLE